MSPAFAGIYAAGLKCAHGRPPESGALGRVTEPTVIRLQFADGAVASTSVNISSGSKSLDDRANDCFAATSPELLRNISGAQSIVMPVDWK